MQTNCNCKRNGGVAACCQRSEVAVETVGLILMITFHESLKRPDGLIVFAHEGKSGSFIQARKV